MNSLFEEVHSLSTSLKDILGAFNSFRPDIGYVQGMCYLAAMLLIHQTRPETCFVSFCNLIHKFDLLHDFYMADSVQILRTYKVFWRLIREYTPILYQNLKDNDATCHMFLQPWIITLFSSSFEIDTCAVLWDQVFYYGQNHILRVALAICQITERRFRNEMAPKDGKEGDAFDIDFQAVKKLRNAREYVTSEELFQALRHQKLELKYIDKLFDKVKKKV